MGKLRLDPFDADWFLAEFPFDAEAVAFIKGLPPKDRGFDSVRRAWRVSYKHLREVVDIGCEFFDQVVYINLDKKWRDFLDGVEEDAAPSGDFAVLHLLASAPPKVVDMAYKAMALLNHPDHGGDAEKMKQINAAYARLKASR